MCGINGLLLNSEIDPIQFSKDLVAMNNLIIHRGPDDSGTFVEVKNGKSIGMAMRRLSIIDLASGHQPMQSRDKSISIVFNGEIYNFKKLKDQLVEQNHHFQTHSDTEVILKLYEAYGVQGFKLLDGMYAFSIYDSKKRKVYIARDYFGEKPLYFLADSDKFIWASELKSIVSTLKRKPSISLDGLNLFFRLTYIPAPFTIYESIFKLEGNHYLEFDLENFNYEIHQIHPESENNKTKQKISFKSAKQQVHDMVFDSVESRTVSDVPIGTFLSGGVDSSIVSLCLSHLNSQKIDTFSIGFEKKSYDETDKSREVAKLIKSNHHEFIISEKDLSQNIDTILSNFDEPFADSSALPTYLVSNKTSKHVKVALTGDGGDEVFGGYNKYYMGKLNARYIATVPQFIHDKINTVSNKILKDKADNRGFKYRLNRLINAVDYSGGYYWDIISLGFTDSDLKSYLNSNHQKTALFQHYQTKSGIINPKSLNDYMAIDKIMSLEGDMLVKVDRTSMLNSLECRAPFLNRALFEFTRSLPSDYLLKKWNKKYILKSAFESYFPQGFLDKSKRGFGVPVGDWLRAGLREELLTYSEANFLAEQGIFNVDSTTALIQNHLNAKQDNTFKVWCFYCFQKWYSKTYNT